MGGIAFVFAGQGAQFPGMGKEIYESSPAAKDLFDRYEKLYPGLKNLCFEGTDEELKKTEITQPCMYAVETAVFAALAEKVCHLTLSPDFLSARYRPSAPPAP